MIERHYGALLDGAGAGVASRLDALNPRTRPGRRRLGRFRAARGFAPTPRFAGT